MNSVFFIFFNEEIQNVSANYFNNEKKYFFSVSVLKILIANTFIMQFTFFDSFL
jgi:hypothetical protein